jgi:hypothetical protein
MFSATMIMAIFRSFQLRFASFSAWIYFWARGGGVRADDVARVLSCWFVACGSGFSCVLLEMGW